MAAQGAHSPRERRKTSPDTHIAYFKSQVYVFLKLEKTFMEKHQTLLKYTNGNSERRLKSLRSTQKGEICVSQGLTH